MVHTRYDKRILDICFLSNALFYNLNQSIMSIGRRPTLEAKSCRFKSYYSDQNNMALVLMVAHWIPNPKVRVRIFQAMPKTEVLVINSYSDVRYCFKM